MATPDLVLLHAPSVYVFRRRGALFGPVSDVVPSTQVFEMYPIGFMTMLAHLERHGYSVRIINVALRMLRSERLDVERLLASLHPLAFGLDLHWLVHAQGSLALAEVVKRHHPDVPVIFGGLSASYYHEELAGYPQVDYVVRGDSAEEPLRLLMGALRARCPPEDVPNLTWKRDGEIVVNPLTHVPAHLDDVRFDYRQIIRSCVRHRDVVGHLPFLAWSRYPIAAVPICRGCIHDCVTCGGSRSAFAKTCGRTAPAFRDPALLAEDIGTISRYSGGPCIVLGDLLQGGTRYAESFVDVLAQKRPRNHIALEFFAPPPQGFVERLAHAVPRFNIQISPESHDETVRRAFGRAYDNESLEAFIGDALRLGCRRLDLFFMIGLPEQTPESVRDTLRYCRTLLARFDPASSGRLNVFISPLAPFLDPGSRAFEHPERYGYRLFHRTLDEHRRALLAPSWKYTLNYETVWMSRDQLVDSVYEAALGLNRLKQGRGLIGAGAGQRIAATIEREWRAVGAIDEAVQIADERAREATVHAALAGLGTVRHATLCGEDEMSWPSRLSGFHPLRILKEACAQRWAG